MKKMVGIFVCLLLVFSVLAFSGEALGKKPDKPPGKPPDEEQENIAVGNETQIMDNTADQLQVDVYDNKIVWADLRNENLDIYMYDLGPDGRTGDFSRDDVDNDGDDIIDELDENFGADDGGEYQITTDPYDQWHPSIYNNIIVWEDLRNADTDIYMYDINTGIETLITDSSDQFNPAIFGNIIVWEDYDKGDSDICMYDITTGIETRLTTDSSNQINPVIYGDKIVWENHNPNTNSDIAIYDIQSHQITILDRPYNQYQPAIYDNIIVFVDRISVQKGKSNKVEEDFSIYMYNLFTQEEKLLTNNKDEKGNPDIYGEIIVWWDSRNDVRNVNQPWDIYMYDLSNDTEDRVTTNEEYQGYPVIFKNNIVYEDARNGNLDIYIFTLTQYLDLARSPEEAILVFEADFLADTSTELKVDYMYDISIYIPAERAESPITLYLDFEGQTDPNDNFHDIIYGKTDSIGHVIASASCPDEGESISWTISDPSLLTQGHWYFQIYSYYDKDIGENPRTLKVHVLYDDNTYVNMVYICAVKIAAQSGSTVRFTYTVAGGSVNWGGSNPAFFMGETAIETVSGNSYVDNLKITDFAGNPIRTIGKKSFNGYLFQFPIGLLNHYDPVANDLTVLNKLVYDWEFDTELATRLMTHINEAGNYWNDVQITYDLTYKTNEYYCWASGIAANPAVLRMGTGFRVVGTNSVLETNQATITIKNSAASDVTSSFTISMEPGMDYKVYDGKTDSWRENWIIEIPTSIAVGKYTIFMSASTWTSSSDFYIIFDPYTVGMTDAQIETYAYDEDSNGIWFGGDDDAERDEYSAYYSNGDNQRVYTLWSFKKNIGPSSVLDLSIAAIDGTGDQFEAMQKLYRLVNQRIDWWFPTYNYDVENILNDNNGKNIGLTYSDAETYSDENTDLTANYPGKIVEGQCMDFGNVLTAMSRSVGIPARATTATKIFGWGYHVWTEVYLPDDFLPKQDGKTTSDGTTDSDSDNWYLFDSCDNYGSDSPSKTHAEEAIDPRVDYYRSSTALSGIEAYFYTYDINWNPKHTGPGGNPKNITSEYKTDVEFWITGNSASGVLGWGDKDFYRISLTSSKTLTLTLTTTDLTAELYARQDAYPGYLNDDYVYDYSGTSITLSEGTWYLMVASTTIDTGSFRGNTETYTITVN
jgi:beta propeller repeat protein